MVHVVSHQHKQQGPRTIASALEWEIKKPINDALVHYHICNACIFTIISHRNPRAIRQRFDTWLQNWSFISQWSAQPFNHAHFRKTIFEHENNINIALSSWVRMWSFPCTRHSLYISRGFPEIIWILKGRSSLSKVNSRTEHATSKNIWWKQNHFHIF